MVSVVVLPAKEGIRIEPAPEGYKAPYVIYSAPFPGHYTNPVTDFSKSVQTALKLADSKQFKSIGFPALSSQEGKLSVKDIVETMNSESRQCFMNYLNLTWIGLVFTDTKAYREAELILFPKKETKPARFYG
jgi:O-acetyl-ADP-ribose deacetylase (regulator of RNase III)